MGSADEWVRSAQRAAGAAKGGEEAMGRGHAWRRWGAALALVAAGGAGCGATTAPEGPCVVPLIREQPVVMLVVDHSYAFAQEEWADLGGDPDYLTWSRVMDTLRPTLPALNDYAAVGVYAFPDLVPPDSYLPNWCGTAGTPLLAPAPASVSAVVSYLDAFGARYTDDESLSNGLYPRLRGLPRMRAALRVAKSALGGMTAGRGPRLLVLVSNGEAECEEDDEPCLFHRHCAIAGAVDPNAVGADDRAMAEREIAALAAAGIPTLVLGIPYRGNAETLSRESAFLSRFATAGGLARPDAERAYYDLRDPTEVGAAFEATIGAAAFCSVHLGAQRRDLDRFDLAGTAVGRLERDPEHRDGWDWIDRETGALRVYGEACRRVVAQRDELVLTAPERCGA